MGQPHLSYSILCLKSMDGNPGSLLFVPKYNDLSFVCVQLKKILCDFVLIWSRH